MLESKEMDRIFRLKTIQKKDTKHLTKTLEVVRKFHMSFSTIGIMSRDAHVCRHHVFP